MIAASMLLGLILVISSLGAWTFIHHDLLSLSWGNILICVEIAAMAASAMAGYFWAKGKRHFSAAIAVFSSVILAFWLAWWASPWQTYVRADSRSCEIERSYKDSIYKDQSLTRDQRLRISVKLTASQIETKGALFRATNLP